ncbi:hypothetical protein SEA_OCTOBIEN14_142 [Gordonia phage Octobien14]|uniref:Uncharacterized protein n=1 Tax=Gordonia phage Octobien14 TaxID=2483673 RepID=A0A3G3MAY8_9CAUD|nr:hypothetical protein L3Y22_gp102 [Gordonia phage Octobien14]AYR03287.1 hypothetical protein SEA_OCTOBIEN14_142 [Gordonia phage Octobien14]
MRGCAGARPGVRVRACRVRVRVRMRSREFIWAK